MGGGLWGGVFGISYQSRRVKIETALIRCNDPLLRQVQAISILRYPHSPIDGAGRSDLVGNSSWVGLSFFPLEPWGWSTCYTCAACHEQITTWGLKHASHNSIPYLAIHVKGSLISTSLFNHKKAYGQLVAWCLIW